MSRRSGKGRKASARRKVKQRARSARPTLEQLECRVLPSGNPVPEHLGDPSPIKHVIYVIKENRTYDQVLGNLGRGNGDASLNLFGDESAANQRALAKRFVTLDNFYADSEVSADGWNWDTGALANTYVQKAWPQNYGGRARPYDFEGGNFATSSGANPTDAFIWDKLDDAGISFRNYGFRVFAGQVASTEPRLAKNTDLAFAGFDLTKPDASKDPLFLGGQPTRYDEWAREFQLYVASNNLPTVEFVRLPNDHTAGALNGAPTPRAYVADNDLALGKLVDTVSHSPYWKDTAIFVVEDDAQDGPDHVDAHRTIAQVISPYTQTGKVDSTFYSTVSMLHTLEQIVGIPPMTQFDAEAPLMVNSFTDQPDLSSYTAITPTQNMAEKNPAGMRLAGMITAADFVKEDLVEPQLLNTMIWESVKGDTPMPAPHTIFPSRPDHGTNDAKDGNPHPGPQGDGTGVTPQGWRLTPAGTQVDLTGKTAAGDTSYADRPYGLARSPDGKTLLISNDGQSTGQDAPQTQSLMVVDLASKKVVQTIPYKSPAGLFVGVTYSPDGKYAYASGEAVDPLTKVTQFVVHVYKVNGQQLTDVAPIVLSPFTFQDPTGQVTLNPKNPAGLTVSPDGGTLYVADNLGDSMSAVKLNPDRTTSAVQTMVKVGHNPYTVVLSKDGKTAYVSNWGDSTVSVVNVTAGVPTAVKTIQVGTHPNAMALNPKANELYVANADSDSVTVVNTTTNLILRKISLAPYFGARVGASPDGLAVSPDGKTLYVTNATDNDVAVIRLAPPGSLNETGARDKVMGLIPTGWFPAGIVVSIDGRQLDVINAKGLGAGPNPNGPNPYKVPESAPDQYLGSMIKGTLSIIDVPGSDRLKDYTEQVFDNNHFPQADEGDKDGNGEDDKGSRGDGKGDDRSDDGDKGQDGATRQLGDDIQHWIVIYQENWSFDSLYGLFPGANGLRDAAATNPNSLTQVDRLSGKPIRDTGPLFHPAYKSDPDPMLNPPSPLINDPVTGQLVPDPRVPPGVDTLHPYNLSKYLTPDMNTGDLVHRFYQEQSQIDGGKMDQFVTWSDNPGLVMSYFDASNLPEGNLARQYTMADNFYHSAFGGSFLNHQFLVSAAAPVYPDAPVGLKPILDANGRLMLDQNGKIIKDGNVTPDDYAVNTIFSRNLVPDFVTDPFSTSLLPSINDSDPTQPNYQPTIGDRLSEKGVSWKWYAGGWNDALAGHADPLFQWHHQAFAYYDNYGPDTAGRAAHLQDEKNFFDDLKANRLPAVSFIKPLGPDNEHPGYADLVKGQQHVADLVAAVQNSPEWAHTAIVITYDENGGRWDHAAPPSGDRWGPGSRVPAIVISPFAKHGFIDHTQYETDSILKTLEQVYGIKPLAAHDAHAHSLVNAFDLGHHGHEEDSVGHGHKGLAAKQAGAADLPSSRKEALDVLFSSLGSVASGQQSDRQGALDVLFSSGGSVAHGNTRPDGDVAPLAARSRRPEKGAHSTPTGSTATAVADVLVGTMGDEGVEE
jgi:acid phosphatase